MVQRERMERRRAEAKASRKARKQGRLPSRCVAIVNEKAHGNDGLPLVKVSYRLLPWHALLHRVYVVQGDIIEITSKDDSRYRGMSAWSCVFKPLTSHAG
jgi:hypothetical protein